MAVAFEDGFTFSGNDGKKAHMLHRGNRFKSRYITASHEVSGYEGEAADTAMTDDVWKPFSNMVESPSDFSDAFWTKSNVTVDDDGQTWRETATTGTHIVRADDFVAIENIEYVFSARFKLIGGRGHIVVVANDGASAYSATFNAYDGSIGGNSPTSVVDLGGGEYLLRTYYTPNAGTLDLILYMRDDTSGASYDGDPNQPIKVLEVSNHPSVATWDFETFDENEGDTFCIAGHNLGDSEARVTFLHDSNDDDTYTEIGYVDVTDNSPIMFFHDGITSRKWRVTVSRASLPSIAVIRVGKLLQWPQAFYAGFTPSVSNRKTVMRGNVSIGGKWLGRTKVRTSFGVTYSWDHLKTDWMRANVIGPDGVLQSLEDEPFFLAWRPSEEPDVDYSMTSGQDGWSNMGVVDMISFSIQAEVHGYD